MCTFEINSTFLKSGPPVLCGSGWLRRTRQQKPIKHMSTKKDEQDVGVKKRIKGNRSTPPTLSQPTTATSCHLPFPLFNSKFLSNSTNTSWDIATRLHWLHLSNPSQPQAKVCLKKQRGQRGKSKLSTHAWLISFCKPWLQESRQGRGKCLSPESSTCRRVAGPAWLVAAMWH